MNTILSFVVIEYFSIDEIESCVKSISEMVGNLSYEIIVSSNSQYDESKRREILFKVDKENVKWLFNEKNGGFAYGMNQGLRIADGKYRIIMNPDVKILQGLSEMVRFMDENPQIGAIAPQVISVNGEIQDSCRHYVSLQSFVIRTIRRILERTSAILSNDIDYGLTQTVDWVIGAFIMVRENVVKLTGGLDEYYFMYAEDLDWCTRIRQSKYEIVYFPSAKIEYKGSRSARRSFKYAKIFLKSHLYYWRKFGFVSGYPKRKKMMWR